MKTKFAFIKILAAIAGLAITTASAVEDPLQSQHGILLLTANGGINPATGWAWEYGDEYRLVFATSMGIDGTSANIADYDQFVQDAANASTFRGGALGNITWKALVSTPTVAANANTGTFGVGGESFWLVNGITVVADNYGDLYGSGTHSNAINMSETGGSPLNNGSYSSLWTGSDGSGNPVLGNELGASGGISRGGLWGFTSGAHWISRFNLSQTTGGNSGDGKFAIYAISEVLTVRDGDSAPTLLPSSIVDDRDGDPVAINDLVTYTVTFSKDMDDITVTKEDFDNAGTSDVTIGTVAETGPGVFSVQATPTTAGTLILKVNKDAVLDDETGNSLDTSSAIADDTTIMVDNTAPTLASTDIVDDQGGSSVDANTPVIYTVSFSEAMDESTVIAEDFDNAGTAPVNITIVIIDDSDPDAPDPIPGLFSVEVTPTGGGTLQLGIKQGTILKDVAGNNLVTTSEILDDTTITVNGTVSNPYDTWAGSAVFGDDANGDGVDNGLAWSLGALNANADATDLLPTYDYTTDPAYIICTFRRSDEAEAHADTTIVVEYGTSLGSGSWTTAVHDNNNVIITETNNHYSTSPGIDRVVVKLKRSTLGAGGKLFARLRVEQSP